MVLILHGGVKIPQIGTVIVEDDVEIGSCVCIDRAKFGATKIGHGTKIDNLVQIAHNCDVGPFCILVGQCGLAGSVKLGAGVVIAGQSAIRDHVSIGGRSCNGNRSRRRNERCGSEGDYVRIARAPHRQAVKQCGAACAACYDCQS